MKPYWNHIERTNWSNVLSSRDANVAMDLFTEWSNAVMDIHAPFKTINVKENTPACMNREYLSHVDERNYLSKVYRKNPTNDNLERKKDSIICTNSLRESLQGSFFQESLQKHPGGMKRLWQTIKRFWSYLAKQSPSQPATNESVLKALANSFNEFFAGVGANLASTIPPSHDSPILPDPHLPVFELD